MVGLLAGLRVSSSPLTAGLKTATRRPPAAAVRASTAATTVLPTSVPVPVTKSPALTPGAFERGGGEARRTVARASAHVRCAITAARALQLVLAVRGASPSAAAARSPRARSAGGSPARRRRASSTRSQSAIASLGVADHDRDDLGAAGRRRGRGGELAADQGRVRAAGGRPARARASSSAERGFGGGDDRRRQRGREDERPRGVDQQLADLAARSRRRRRSRRAPCRACRRSRRPRPQAGLGDRAAAAGPERAGARAPRRPSAGSRGGGRARRGPPSGATSPSIEKTPSVTISAGAALGAPRPQARCSRSPWRRRTSRRAASRQPSMMLAWLRLVREDDLAAPRERRDRPGVGQVARAEEQRRLGAVEAARRSSRRRVDRHVPEISREAPAPVPQRIAASAAASRTAGWSASPR